MRKVILPLGQEERQVLERHLRTYNCGRDEKQICLKNYPVYSFESDVFGFHKVCLLDHHALIEMRGNNLVDAVKAHYQLLAQVEGRRVH